MSPRPTFHRKSDVSDHQSPNAHFYEWNSPSNSIKIRLDLDTARRLGLVVQEGFEALATRGLEVGGLLLGRFIPEDGPVTVIEDFEPLESEHRHGPSYTLSEKDRKLLERRLSAHANTRGLGVVGYWRSHIRPGLNLDRQDYSTIRTFFTHPFQVFLLVKPSAARQSVGGLFFWEDGDIRRESPYEEFLFDGLAAGHCGTSSPAGLTAGDCGPARPGWLSPDPPTSVDPEDDINTARPRTPASDRRPARPAWPSRDPERVEYPARRSNTSNAPSMRTRAEEAAAAGPAWAGPSNRPDFPSASAPIGDRQAARHVRAGLYLPAAENPIGPSGASASAGSALWRFRMHTLPWIWLASAVVLMSILIVCSLVIRSVSSPAATAMITQPAPSSTIEQPAHARPSMFSEFSLNVEPTANSLRLGWNRDSQIIQNAPAGLLLIRDGARHLRVDLDKRLLSKGSIVYVPSEGDVEFELEVAGNGRLVSESVRALVPTPTAPVAAKLKPAPPPSADQTGEPMEPQQMQKTARMPRPRATSTPGESVARADVTPFQPPSPEPNPVFSGGTPVDALALPPVLAPTPIDAAAELPAGKLYDTATITYEPVRPPALQRVLRKFPGLRRLQRFDEGDGKEFVPPKPRRELAFLVPDGTGREAALRKPVNLKMSLDESGKVTRVEPLSNGPMAGVAAHAALAWRFTPARWKDKPVASEVMVHLRFDGDSRSTAANTVRNSSPASAPRN
jgi:hypothetical protein